MEGQALAKSRKKAGALDRFDVQDWEAPVDTIELTAKEKEEVCRQAIHSATMAKRSVVRRWQYGNQVAQQHKKTAQAFTHDEYRTVLANGATKELNLKYIIDDENRQVIELLTKYFAQDPDFEKLAPQGFTYSLKKGIYLFGDVGSGKTLIMRHLRNNQVKSYRMIRCRDIALQYADEGRPVVERYSRYSPDVDHSARDLFQQTESGYCFDDLGTESTAQNFGNKINVMEQILMNWYDSGKWNSIHLTTNLNADDIEEAYGSRLRSRFRQMFNIISFPPGSKDRRI